MRTRLHEAVASKKGSRCDQAAPTRGGGIRRWRQLGRKFSFSGAAACGGTLFNSAPGDPICDVPGGTAPRG